MFYPVCVRVRVRGRPGVWRGSGRAFLRENVGGRRGSRMTLKYRSGSLGKFGGTSGAPRGNLAPERTPAITHGTVPWCQTACGLKPQNSRPPGGGSRVCYSKQRGYLSKFPRQLDNPFRQTASPNCISLVPGVYGTKITPNRVRITPSRGLLFDSMRFACSVCGV